MSDIVALASLGWVSPGAATEGVTPIFQGKLTTFLVITVCQFCGVTPSEKTDDLFCSSLSLLFISLGCYPMEGVSHHTFLYVRPRLSTIIRKFAHNFFLWVSPPGGCHPRRSAPPPASPSSDASDCLIFRLAYYLAIKAVFNIPLFMTSFHVT